MALPVVQHAQLPRLLYLAPALRTTTRAVTKVPMRLQRRRTAVTCPPDWPGRQAGSTDRPLGVRRRARPAAGIVPPPVVSGHSLFSFRRRARDDLSEGRAGTALAM